MKKIISFLAAVSVLCAITSCTENSQSSLPAEEVSVTQTMYKEERAEFPEDMRDLCNIGYVENSGVRITYQDKDRVFRYADYDENMQARSAGELFTAENIFNTYFNIAENGSISVLVMYVESEYDIGTEEFYENAELTFEIRRYSPSGDESVISISGMDNYFSLLSDYIQKFTEIDGKYIVSTSSGRLMIGENGEITDVCEDDSLMFYCTDVNGKIIAASRQGFSVMDEISLEVPEKQTEYGKYLNLSQGIAVGHDGFEAYFMLNDGVFGLTEGGNVVQVMDYNDSMMTCGDYYDVVYAGTGRFAAVGHDDGGNYLAYMTVRPDGYVMNRESVVVGVAGNFDDRDREMATKYNKKSDSYTVELKVFDSLDDLKGEILSGSPPDVYSFYDASDMYRLVNLGAAADMYELSEKYGGFKKEDMMDNIISAYEYKDGLYMMSQQFQFSLTLGNKKFFPDSKVSYGELFDIADNMPEGTYFTSALECTSPSDVFDRLCTYSLSDWVDLEKSECHFDNAEFVQLLEFTKTVPLLPAIDWETFNAEVGEDEQEIFYEEERSRLKNGTALLRGDTWMHSLYDMRTIRQFTHMDIDEITFLRSFGESAEGYVYSNEYYSVIANGNCPEGGWDYINFLVSDQFLTSYLQTKRNFVTRKESFEKINERILYEQEQAYKDGTEDYVVGDTHSMIADISDKELEFIMAHISECTDLYGNSQDIQEIIKEEYAVFEAGEVTAERCAELIQNRVSIYLSEIS